MQPINHGSIQDALASTTGVSPLRTSPNGHGPLPIDSSFDTAFAEQMARLESYNKHHYRPNTYMHKWWARRCGSTFRLILKHLVTDEAQRDYYAPGGLAGKVLLDPMMGGGTTLHEAIRLGANVAGADLDPIPVLQARATLSEVPIAQLEEAFRTLYAALDRRISPLFETECPQCNERGPLRFVLYGAQRSCDCGPAILVDSLVLRYENGRPQVRLCARCHRVLYGTDSCECQEQKTAPPLVEKRQTACAQCGCAYEEDLGRPFYRRYQPLVVVGQCARHGLFYASPRAVDRERLAAADEQRASLYFEDAGGFLVNGGPKSRDLHNHGVQSYLELFSSRQLLYLHETLRILPQFSPLVRLNMALLVSTSLEFNSMLCGYKGARRGDRPGAIRHTFSYHAYSFPYTALENNLLYPQRASGTLEKLFHDRIRRARKWARRPRERDLSGGQARFVRIEGEVDLGSEVKSPELLNEGQRRFFLHQGSSICLPLACESVDFVVTDPPYYDNVQYGDLAAFFRVWLERMAPETEASAFWSYDMRQAAVDSSDNGSDQYMAVLSGIFSECRRVMKPEGRLIFTYHHWKPRGWSSLTMALRRAGFVLLNRYVVHSENPISVHINNLRSLTHDAILVLAARDSVPAPPWERPKEIDHSESKQFCLDCSELMGWALQAELDEKGIRRLWREALRG